MARKKKTYRLMYRFWLDVNRHDEEAIADTIEVLKNDRTFTSVIRDGIRLVTSLRNGDLSVLLELFPDVKEKLTHKNTTRQLSAIELLINEMRREAQQPKQIIGTIQPLIKPVAPPPIDDDDDLDIVIEKDENSGKNVSNNFLNSIMNLQN